MVALKLGREREGEIFLFSFVEKRRDWLSIYLWMMHRYPRDMVPSIFWFFVVLFSKSG